MTLKSVNVAGSALPGVETVPIVENALLAGRPSVPSCGGGAAPFGFGEAPAVQVVPSAVPVTGARWTVNVRTLLLPGDVKVNRTSLLVGPASNVPTVALRSVGASAPRLMHRLNIEIPAGLGSYVIWIASPVPLPAALSSALKPASVVGAPRIWNVSLAS